MLPIIEKNSFGSDEESYCDKMFVSNDKVKELLKKSDYPENRISFIV